MRSLILILALASAAAACKSGGDTAAGPQVVPGAPAGDVTELSGDVHATRAGTTRALAALDVVSGDDLIATGSDGRVVIVLRHNQVAWSLGPNRAKKVGDSAAWAAAKGARATEDVTDDHSAAAGRHAERSATDTAASTGNGSGSALGSGSGSGSDDAERVRQLQQQLAQAEDEQTRAKMRAELEAQDRQQAEQRVDGHASTKGKATAKKCDPNDPLCDLDNDRAPGGPSGGGEVEGALDPAVIRRVVHTHAAAFRACYETLVKTAPDAKGKLKLHLTIAADGKVSHADVDGDAALAPMFDCARTAAAALVFPKDVAAIIVTYPMTFSGP